MVVCQPGTTDVAKSKDTTECTESTSGVERAGEEQVGHFVVAPLAVAAAPAEGEDAVEHLA